LPHSGNGGVPVRLRREQKILIASLTTKDVRLAAIEKNFIDSFIE
jgi:hypothetical protein